MSKEIAPVEDRSDDGPAMQKLSNMQRLFVLTYIRTNHTVIRCAAEAGYANPAVSGPMLMASPKIRAAVNEASATELVQSAHIGMRVLRQIAETPGHKDQLRAARELVAHAGLAPAKEQKITVEHTGQRPEELKAEIRQLLAQIGPDAQRLLTAANLEVVDAEFTPVPAVATDDLGNEW